MTNYNPKNERIKRDYFRYLREARRQSEHSVDLAAKAIDRFEVSTKRRDFARFNIEQAAAFKRHLAEQTNTRTGKALSASTQLQTLAALHDFFIWLADQPGYRKTIRYHHADYFNFPRKDAALVHQQQELKGPTLEQIRHVLACMPSESPVQKRDRAIVALIILSGARDDAIASLRLKHLDLEERRLLQRPRDGVRTKASKTMAPSFFPVGADFVAVLQVWIECLVSLHWGPDDPLFPPCKIGLTTERRFGVVGFSRNCWSNASPIRKIFKEAFEAAGLPYFHPHSFRNTLARLMPEMCRNPLELWVWSQNLGHEHLMTTLGSYGHLDETAKALTMGSLWNAQFERTLGKTSLMVSAKEMAVLTPLLEAVRNGAGEGA